MAERVDGKVAIVTGAAHGLGATIALSFARLGANVAAVDICHDLPATPYSLAAEGELNQVVEEMQAIGRRAIGVKCDVSMADEVERMVKRVVDEYGKIDILVNNAAVVTENLVMDMTESEWDICIDVNLKGQFLCCKHVLPHMIARKSGKIVNIGSINGREALPRQTAYNCSKAGVQSLTDSISKEVAEHNINVNCVAPGAIQGTPMGAWAAQALGAAMDATTKEFHKTMMKRLSTFGRPILQQDIANVVLFLASEESRSLTGYTIYCDGGHKGVTLW